MKASVRCQSLDMAGLARAEKHGRRLDWIGRQRKIRDADPLVAGGLELVDLYAAHVEGARQNKGAKKPVLHFIVRLPPEVLTDEGPPPFADLDRAGREWLMVEQAVRFINETHGGEAVFAARLDRDEAGETVVDVFACPRYMKESKSARREPTLWTSATRFGEELARKHQDHIRGRMKAAQTAKAITSPRAVGIALQEEFAQFFARENGVRLDPRKLKEGRARDRIEVEEWRLRTMERDRAEAEAEAARAGADAERIAAKSGALLTAVAALAEEVNAGTLRRDERGKMVAANVPALAGGLPDLRDAIQAGADAVDARRRAEADAAAVRVARESAEADQRAAALARAEADADREEVRGALRTLTRLLGRLGRWMLRPDLPVPVREEGAAILRKAGLPVPEPDVADGGGGRKVRASAMIAAAIDPLEPLEQPIPSGTEATVFSRPGG